MTSKQHLTCEKQTTPNIQFVQMWLFRCLFTPGLLHKYISKINCENNGEIPGILWTDSVSIKTKTITLQHGLRLPVFF